ncbi:MAG: hypothetical protein ACK4WH_09085 [Phycisphaerales bacterium]
MKTTSPIRVLTAAAALALSGAAFGQTSMSLVNGQLTLITPNFDQNVKVEMKGPERQAALFGFPGIADGTLVNGVSAIAVITGAGRDEVQFDIEQASSLSIISDTGAGDALTKMQWKIRPSQVPVDAAFEMRSSVGGLQLAELQFDPETAGEARINVNSGNAGEVKVKINSDDPSSRLSAAITARGAKTEVEVISAASELAVIGSGVHAAPFNEVKYGINQIRPGSVAVAMGVTMGSGNDKFEGKLSAPGSSNLLTGVVNAGGGDDFVLFEVNGQQSIIGLALEGAAGNDHLEIKNSGVFQLSQSVGARLSGGAGDDRLLLSTDSIIRGTGLPNDVIPIIDGGPGFDLYLGFGEIRNCEGQL